jgi:hypothetical protein
LVLACLFRARNRQSIIMQRPAGVTAIAILFFLAAGYLCVAGAIMLLSRGTLSMRIGAPLLHGLELAGPFMFLLVGAVGALIGWGLMRLNNWARRAAVVAVLVGVVMLIPSVSESATNLNWPLAWGGLGIMLRAAVAWYLLLGAGPDAFQKQATKLPG